MVDFVSLWFYGSIKIIVAVLSWFWKMSVSHLLNLILFNENEDDQRIYSRQIAHAKYTGDLHEKKTRIRCTPTCPLFISLLISSSHLPCSLLWIGTALLYHIDHLPHMFTIVCMELSRCIWLQLWLFCEWKVCVGRDAFILRWLTFKQICLFLKCNYNVFD